MSTIKLRRSATAAKVPTTTALSLGELAINTYDGKLYIKKNVTGTESIVAFSDIADNTTSELAEGTNLYYTTTRANTAIDNRVTKTFVDALGVNSSTIGGLSASQIVQTTGAQSVAGVKTFTDDIVMDKGVSTINLGSGTNGGPHGIKFYTATNTVGIQLVFRTGSGDARWENSLEEPIVTIESDTSNVRMHNDLNVNGNATVTSDVNAANFNTTSDRTVKESIETLTDALEKVHLMRGVSFNFKKDKKPHIGVIAQEVEEVIPELVHTDQDGLKSVAYGNLVGLLIEAIKEQQTQIDELKSIVNT